MHWDAAALGNANFALDSHIPLAARVVELRMLASSNGERAPAKVFGEVLFGVRVNVEPNGLDVVVLKPIDVCVDHLRKLLVLQRE